MTLAKALANGLPMGAMLARESVGAAFGQGAHASTFGGTPIVSAAAREVCRIMESEGIVERCRKTSEHFRGRLEWLRRRHPVIEEVRGLGLLLGIKLAVEGDAYVQRCMDAGFLINCVQGNILRFVPPLIVTPEEIDRLVDLPGPALRRDPAAGAGPCLSRRSPQRCGRATRCVSRSCWLRRPSPLLAGCGRKLPPIQPGTYPPPAVRDLAFQVRGEEVVLSWTVPAGSPDKDSPAVGFKVLRSRQTEQEVAECQTARRNSRRSATCARPGRSSPAACSSSTGSNPGTATSTRSGATPRRTGRAATPMSSTSPPERPARMDTVPFTKMSGSGNDFILIDNRARRAGRGQPRRLRRRGLPAAPLGRRGRGHPDRARRRRPTSAGASSTRTGARPPCAATAPAAPRASPCLQGVCGPRLRFETGAGVIEARVDGRRVRVKLTEPGELANRRAPGARRRSRPA